MQRGTVRLERREKCLVGGARVALPRRGEISDPRAGQPLAREHAHQDVRVGVRKLSEWIGADERRAVDHAAAQRGKVPEGKSRAAFAQRTRAQVVRRQPDDLERAKLGEPRLHREIARPEEALRSECVDCGVDHAAVHAAAGEIGVDVGSVHDRRQRVRPIAAAAQMREDERRPADAERRGARGRGHPRSPGWATRASDAARCDAEWAARARRRARRSGR